MTALPSRTPAMRVRPVKRADARAFVAAHHSHHRALGAFVEGELAVVVLANPVAPELEDGKTWEVPRLSCGPRAPRFAASRLLRRATRVGLSAGLSGRPHDTGNRAARWLPRLEDAVRSTEVIDRVRWEIGPRAGEAGAHCKGERWLRRRRQAA